MTLPSLFISHGAPTLAIKDGPARRFLQTLGTQLKEPRAIIMMSAHHDSQGRGALVSTTAQYKTTHDFSGFPEALYRLQYNASGSSELARQIIEVLRKEKIDAFEDVTSGLDHGAWVPLMSMYHKANVPIVRISTDVTQTPDWHFRLGKAIRCFRHLGCLIIGSGSATHNLREFFKGHYQHNAPAPEWVTSFAEWLSGRVENGDVTSVLDAVSAGPNGTRNHPSMDHILPLFFAMGAGDPNAPGIRLHKSTTYGVLSMDMYGFGETKVLNTLKD